jgi:hypothetical protein
MRRLVNIIYSMMKHKTEYRAATLTERQASWYNGGNWKIWLPPSLFPSLRLQLRGRVILVNGLIAKETSFGLKMTGLQGYQKK